MVGGGAGRAFTVCCVTDAPVATLTACTVASVAELPSVRVLLRSFLAHHPGVVCHVLLVDAASDLPELDRAVFLHPELIGVSGDELDRLRTACTPERLCAVLRPRMMSWLLASPDTSGPVLYLAPSVLVLASVADIVLAGLVERCLVLVPRTSRPLVDDGRRPDAADLRAAGVFDPAFIAVNRGAEDLLTSWSTHTLAKPDDADAFLSCAVALWDPHVVRDPGIGLSVWNADHRTLRADADGGCHVDDVPLRTVHFTGFDRARPWLLAADIGDRPRILLSEHPVLARLCARYVGLLSEAAAFDVPAAVHQRVGPAALPAALRADFHQAWLTALQAGAVPPPACASDPAAFLGWACEPVEGWPDSTRWSAALWRDDEDLRLRFPDPFGADAPDFREWCAGPGVSQGALPVEAVPGAPVDEPILTDQLGVSVLGEGSAATLLRAAAMASGLPVSNRPDYPVVVRCDDTGPALDLTNRRYLVSVLSAASMPAAMTGCSATDEIWVPLGVVAAELAGAAGPAVHPIIMPIMDPGERDAAARDTARERLGWPSGAAIVFAALVDHARVSADDALGVVTAFRAAAEDQPDVRLVLLVTGSAEHPEVAERLRLAAAIDDRIRLVEDMAPEARADWLDSADCVVCPHRPELVSMGAMLALARPAVRGIPLVGSATGAVGALLPKTGALLLPDGSAGALSGSIAAVLRSILDDPEGAARIGQVGRAELLRTHSVTAAGTVLRARVEHAYRVWRARRASERSATREDPLRPLRSARHALLRQPDVDVGYKIPMAPALRRAVLRVLSHYDAHLRTVLGTLVDGIERTVEELARRQDAGPLGDGWSELTSERLNALLDDAQRWDERVTGVENGLVRMRAELATAARRLDDAEDVVVGEAAKHGKRFDAMSHRIERLTEALNRTLDRIDLLETRTDKALHERDSRMDTASRAASDALRVSDALSRVVRRDHERRTGGADPVPPPEPPGSLVLCDAGLLRLPADDGVMLPLLSSNGVWEPELSVLIDSLVEPDTAFMDIGAYVGYHTVRVLSRLGTSGTVIAIEPSEPASALLRHNVAVNVSDTVAQRLIVLPAAAWDTPGVLVAEPALTGGVSVRPAPAKSAGDEGDSPALSVPAVRLDREFEENPSLRGLRLSVVKVDTPGRGHRALGGLVRVLRRDRPHVFCAFSAAQTSDIGDDPVSVLREFGTWGYDVVVVGEQEPATPEEILEVAANQHSITLWLRPREGRAGQSRAG